MIDDSQAQVHRHWPDRGPTVRIEQPREHVRRDARARANAGLVRQAIIQGIGRTGRLVTSAALILFLAFAARAVKHLAACLIAGFAHKPKRAGVASGERSTTRGTRPGW